MSIQPNKFLLWLAAVALGFGVAQTFAPAQGITIPNTFVNGTVADGDQVNANFAAIAANALNRNAGTLGGTLNLNGQTLSGNATFSGVIGFTTPLAIASGGTNGSAVPTNGGVPYGTGTAYAFTGAGTAGQVLVSAGAAPPIWASGSLLVGYATTLTPVQNTVAETTILSFDVPANDWADGDSIDIWMLNFEKNNKGTSGVATIKVYAGAGAGVTIAAAAWPDNVSEFTNRRPLQLIRRGSVVEVFGGSDSNRADWGLSQDNVIVRSAGASTPTNFTSLFTVSVKATLDAAHAAFYIKPQSARVRRQRLS